jgi:hypothetical protein
MPVRYAGIRAPGPGSLVDHQHPLGNGCVGCWWPNAAVDAGRGLWIPDLSGHGQHAQFAGSLPTWSASRNGSWGVNISSDAARWLKVPAGPASNRGTGDFSILLGLTPEATIGLWPNALDCRTTGANTYGWSYCLQGEKDGAFIDFCDADRIYFTLSNDGTKAYTAGVWNTLAITCDRDGYARSYKQGTQHGTADISSAAAQVATPASGGYLRIGADNGETANWRLVGVYEFIAIWSYALPPEYIAWLTREPAAMIWEPGRKRVTYPSAGATPITVTHAVGLYAAESYTATRGIGLSGAEQATLERSMTLVAQEVADLSRTLGLSGADTESLTRTMTLRGLEALAATAGTSLQAAEVASATQAVVTYAQEVGTLARTLGAYAQEVGTLTREAGATGADPLALTRALGLYATGGSDAEDLFGTWLAQTFGAETSSLTRGIALWAKEVATGVRDVLRLMDERGTLRLQDLRENLRLQDGRDTLQLE